MSLKIIKLSERSGKERYMSYDFIYAKFSKMQIYSNSSLVMLVSRGRG